MNQTEDTLSVYLQSLSKYPLLSAAQEISLARAIQAMLNPPAGLSNKQLESIQRLGRAAKEKMVSSNLRLVVAVAKKYQNKGLELLDLIQEGNKGLLQAVEKFDPSKGYKFSTYAYWLIRQCITRALANQSRSIRLPTHVLHQLNQIKKAQKRLTQQWGRKPHSAEIAEEVGISLSQLHKLMNVSHLANVSSLDQLAGEDTTLLEMLRAPGGEIPEENLRWEMLRQVLDSQLALLSEKERLAINLRYGLSDGESKTLRATGEKMGLSIERVRQLVVAGSSKLRQHSFLKEFLEA